MRKSKKEKANIPWVTQPAFALQGISQKYRDKEKEGKKERHWDQSSDGAKVF